MRIATLAALRKIPIGTKLRLVRSKVGEVPETEQDREFYSAQNSNILMKKNDGKVSYLALSRDTKVLPVEENGQPVGFQIFTPDSSEIAAEYRFVR